MSDTDRISEPITKYSQLQHCDWRKRERERGGGREEGEGNKHYNNISYGWKELVDTSYLVASTKLCRSDERILPLLSED